MFYLIDKPRGISSFDIIRKLRKILGIKKMGHIGTLDPFATGLVIVATGNSTKLIPLLEGSIKEYVFEVRLDGKSESFDTDTTIVQTSLLGIKKKAQAELIGFILSQKSQVPPKYSALHIEGKRAYERIRDGEIFEIKPRDIHVHEVEIIEQKESSITIRMILSSGGYIRSFGPLLGEFFGVEGGYISSLRRIAYYTPYGKIGVEDATTIDSPYISGYNHSKIFHTIPTMIGNTHLMDDIRNGKTITNKNFSFPTKFQGYFFITDSTEKYTSLCRKENENILIIRNNI